MIKGKDYIGMSCGAFILNDKGELLLMKRNKNCRNTAWYWTIPWWGVRFWETLEDSLIRETMEEVWVRINIKWLLWIWDDIMKDIEQHWIAVSYLCEIEDGQVKNSEPDKCDELKWFSLDNLPERISVPARVWVGNYGKKKDPPIKH